MAQPSTKDKLLEHSFEKLKSAFPIILNKVMKDPAEGLPADANWLADFVTKCTNNGDFNSKTVKLLRGVMEKTVDAWMETIFSQRVQVGYTSGVDLDTAISTRTCKGTQFLKKFRESIRTQTINSSLDEYSNNEWDRTRKVSFNYFVLEPAIVESIYSGHCVLLSIPAAFDDILFGRSNEELLRRYEDWKKLCATQIGVYNCMVKTYYLTGYCVFRRIKTVCDSERSYKLPKSVHGVSVVVYNSFL